MSAPASPRVFSLTSDPAALNAYLVIGRQRAALIDTGAGPRQAAGILTAAEGLLQGCGQSLDGLLVLNTHDHWDHFFGNAACAAAGVEEFAASAAFVRDQAGSAWLQTAEVPAGAEPELPADPGKLIVPVRALADGERIDLGGCQLEVFDMPGHTETDLVVRAGDVVLTGDLVEEGAPPQVGEDAMPHRWAAALDRMLSWQGVRVFGPGHGRPVDAAFVRTQAADLAALAAEEITALPARAMSPESLACLARPPAPESAGEHATASGAVTITSGTGTGTSDTEATASGTGTGASVLVRRLC